MNIQPLIENPFIYKLARCPSNDHQLLYSPEKLNEIIEPKNRIEFNGFCITDIMHVFKGDNHALELENGKPKSRDCFCWQYPLFS